MKPGAKSDLLRGLAEIEERAQHLRKLAEVAKEGPPFSVSVGWGDAPDAVIMFDNREAARHDVEGLAVQCVWALYESIRSGSNPSDVATFDAILGPLVQRIRERCHQPVLVSETATGEESKR